jgi:hypothetical protein
MQVVPYVSPGYDDRRMRGAGRPEVARAEGAQYLKAWQQMQRLLRCQGGARGVGRAPVLAMVNSFNEWHEGTQASPRRTVR